MKQIPGFPSSGKLQKLADVLDEALLLLESQGKESGSSALPANIQPSLFEQCIELCRQVEGREAEPIRTLHQLSCTGGTLITKCLAAMPNVFVLNEVDPLSNMLFDSEKPKFTPTDMLSLVRQGDNQISDEVIINLFIQNLKTLRNELSLKGKRLLLRDHSHSHFLMDRQGKERKTVLTMVAEHFETLSVVTVRNPLDSFLSLDTLSWKSFQPFNLEEYCARYIRFLDAYQGIPVFRYEDFVNEPEKNMEQMCQLLKLPYSPHFAETFDVFRFSGDNGRGGMKIKPRARRPYDGSLKDDAKNSASYQILISRLGYESFC